MESTSKLKDDSLSAHKIWKFLREGDINKAEILFTQNLVSLEERNESGKTLLMVSHLCSHSLLNDYDK